MISQEEFARQLQLSDPQTVAGAFNYFQKVKGWDAECRAQDLRMVSQQPCQSQWMASLESALNVLTAVVRWPSSEVCWGFHFFIEYPVYHRAMC